jgi:uncharacterized protein (TIGR00369 family)
VSAYDPAAHGWRALRGASLPGGLGIPWARKVDDRWHYGLLTTPEHANPAGSVHGGVLMTFADHGLSFLAWEAAERASVTTIQLNTHFLDAIRPGEFIVMRGEVSHRTRGLVFVKGSVTALDTAAERPVGVVDGIWRILRGE